MNGEVNGHLIQIPTLTFLSVLSSCPPKDLLIQHLWSDGIRHTILVMYPMKLCRYDQWGRNGFYLGELPIFFLEILGELLENFSPNITKYSIKNWSYWNLGESRNSGSHQFRPHWAYELKSLLFLLDKIPLQFINSTYNQ